MKWKEAPTIKIYEALGAVADGRVELHGRTAKVLSSSRNKSYDVTYDPETRSIMANDNGSYWKGYLGYPAIAFLLATNVVPFDARYAEYVKNVAWKDVNQKFKNDFDKTLTYILDPLSIEQRAAFEGYIGTLNTRLRSLGLNQLGKRTVPPDGY
jgi:hypothetical protein